MLRIFSFSFCVLVCAVFLVRTQRRQYQTDMVRQKDQSVEDVHKRDTARTAMLVTRTAVHRVTRKAMPSDSR